MDKKEIVSFFNSCADSWDADMVKVQWKIDKILDIAGVTEGKAVLDVACGTGVLIPDYVNRKVSRCVGVDISRNMIEIASGKFKECDNVSFVCAVIYNAFPHFVNRTNLFENILKHLNENGRITVAHGMSRDALIKHHSGRAEKVSSILPEADELAKIMESYFEVDTKISTDEIYIVSGKKRI